MDRCQPSTDLSVALWKKYTAKLAWVQNSDVVIIGCWNETNIEAIATFLLSIREVQIRKYQEDYYKEQDNVEQYLWSFIFIV
jgi:hypothetical protein